MENSPLKISRLQRKEFKEILKKGNSFKEGSLVAKILKNENEREIKIGILVSRKILKKAVARNQAKRKLREIIRLKREKIKRGIKIVFIPLLGFNSDFKILEERVEKILKKAQIIK